jgi:HlyD family secretion protein
MAAKKRRIRWGWVWIVLLTAGGGAYAFWQQQSAAGKGAEIPKGVQLGKVERGSIDQTITGTGVVAAQTGAKVNVGSQITGRIRSLPADVGTFVRANQVIAVLDSPDLEAQVEQQLRNVEVAKAAVTQSESRLTQAGLTAGLSREQTGAQIQEAEFALQAAKERLQQAQAQAKMTPTQTSSEVARAKAALSTAQSAEKQTKATVALQLRQAQNDIEDAEALSENWFRQRKRQEALLVEGYVARQDVENARTEWKRSVARLESAKAAQVIVREKTEADLNNARDRVLEADAALKAAHAGQLQDEMREAEARNAAEAVKQAQATLRLRKSGKTEDLIRRRAIEEARAALGQSRASLRQADALLRYQQAQLDKAIIRSPIDGVVLSISAQQGETIAAGFSAPTLITVADLKRLEVRAYIDEVDVAMVRRGLPAEVRIESIPDRTFKGKVVKIAAASTVKDNVVTYETTVALDAPGDALRPDMTADVALILGRRPGVLKVPYEAVHREVKRTVVYVLHREKQGKERVEMRNVTTGAEDGLFAEIRTGLKEGEEVILAGLPRFGVQAIDSQQQPAGSKEDEK